MAEIIVDIGDNLVETIGCEFKGTIVRCKECKHREEYPCKVYHDDDWYCANGERREP